MQRLVMVIKKNNIQEEGINVNQLCNSVESLQISKADLDFSQYDFGKAAYCTVRKFS